MNIFSADDFAPNPCFHLLSYYHYCPRLSSHQAVNVSSINKPTNCRSFSMSLSTSSQISVGVDTPWSHNSCPYYFYNSRYRLDIADSLKTINQELSQPKDWVSSTISNSQEKFAKLLIIDISMIRATPFDTLVQQAFHAKNIEIFNILICNIEKTLAPKSTTDLAKKLPTEYHDFLNIFS